MVAAAVSEKYSAIMPPTVTEKMRSSSMAASAAQISLPSAQVMVR